MSIAIRTKLRGHGKAGGNLSCSLSPPQIPDKLSRMSKKMTEPLGIVNIINAHSNRKIHAKSNHIVGSIFFSLVCTLILGILPLPQTVQAQSYTNTCPATGISFADIAADVTNVPAGTTVTIHTAQPADATNLASDPITTSGTYYATFYDATNDCYSDNSKEVTVTINTCDGGGSPASFSNTCPATGVSFANIAADVTNVPAGTTVTIHTAQPADATNLASDPITTSGTYYATFYDATNDCYSDNSLEITITIIPCACTAPAAPAISVTDNVCPATTGSFAASTACGTGSSIEWSTDGGTTWSSSTPAWADGVSAVARCVSDADATCVSPNSNAVTASEQDCSAPSDPVCPRYIKIVGEPSICDQINGDATHPLASLDCDGGGKDNITECTDGSDPSDPGDDVAECPFEFDMDFSFNDAGICRFYVTLGCDDTACPITSWDYEITAGTVSITGTSSTTLNAPTSNSFRPSVLGCGNTIRITRADFANAFPAGFGEDITFTLTANSSSCGCLKTSTVIIPRSRAMTFDNQGPQRDITGTTSYIQANGDYVNGSATAMSSWPMPPAPPSWGVGGPTFIESSYVQSGNAVCAPEGWTQMLATAGLSICEVTMEDGTVITLPAGCAVPAAGGILATTIADALNACQTYLDHPSIDGDGLCSSVGTKYDDNLTDGDHACVNWNFMYSTYAIKTLKICEDATGNVVGEFVFGDASVDYGY